MTHLYLLVSSQVAADTAVPIDVSEVAADTAVPIGVSTGGR